MKNFEYSYASIAEAAGKSLGAVRVDVSREKFDPASLLSVSVYITTEKLRGLKHGGE